jgi:hypothetical protein
MKPLREFLFGPVIILAVVAILGIPFHGIWRSMNAPLVAPVQPIVGTMTVTRVEQAEDLNHVVYLVSDERLSYTAQAQLSQYTDPVLGPQTTQSESALPKVGDSVTIRKYRVFPYEDLTGPEYSANFVGFAVTANVGGRQVTSMYSISPLVR